MMCGSCRAACPIFSSTGQESDNARSKVQLSYALQTGDIELTRELADRFYRCTNCRACEHHCPSGIEITALVNSAKQQAFKAGVAPDAILEMVRDLKTTGNIYGKTNGDKPEENFHAESAFRAGHPVLIFPGCRAGFNRDHIMSSMIGLLDAVQENYAVFDDDSICCGLPLLQSGDQEGFKYFAESVQKKIQAIQPEKIVTPCPGCRMAFRQYYHEAGFDLGCRVISTPEYLQMALQSQRISLKPIMNGKMIYHNPCYLRKEPGVSQASSDILGLVSKNPLLDFPSSKHRTMCCGGGCQLDIAAPDISEHMAMDRVQQAMEVGAEVIVTACPSCKLMLEKGSADLSAGYGMRVMDILELARIAGKY
jgi:Fe-S oxidoreductase